MWSQVRLPAAIVENKQRNCACGSSKLDSEKKQGRRGLQSFVQFTCMGCTIL